MKKNLTNLLIDFNKNAERQNLGSTKATLTALSFIPESDNPINLLDIGCGTGAQTIPLAKVIKGKITALDLNPQFLKTLQSHIENTSLIEKIELIEASMDDLPFPGKHFDIIWSEESIHTIGFRKGIRYWKNFIKDNGYLVVSDMSWLTNERPKELTEYCEKKYPEIGLISERIKDLEEEGYSIAATFVADNDPDAQNVVLELNEEAKIYTKYKEYYGSVFYIAKTIN